MLTTTDGLTLFHRADVPSDPRGLVLLWHGLGEHSGRYEHVIAALTGAGFAVHAIDHRGHGRSEGKRAFVRSYDEFMSDLVQFRRLVVEQYPDGFPLVVLGHSMGGNLALGHVLRHPGGVTGLALSAPALKPGDDIGPMLQKVAMFLGRFAPAVRPDGLDATALSRDQKVVADYEDDPLVYSGKLSAGVAAALLGEMATFPGRYAELELPVLVLHGTDDRLANVEGSRELEAGATNADVTAQYYDGLFHEVFNEPERQRVIDDLLAWLDSLVPAAGSQSAGA